MTASGSVTITNAFQFPLHRDNDCYLTPGPIQESHKFLSVPSSSGQRLLLGVGCFGGAGGSSLSVPSSSGQRLLQRTFGAEIYSGSKLSVPSSSGQRLLPFVIRLGPSASGYFQFPLHRDNDCYASRDERRFLRKLPFSSLFIGTTTATFLIADRSSVLGSLSVPSSSGQRLLLTCLLVGGHCLLDFQFPLHRDNDCY